MSENILSVEDLKFLEILHTRFGLEYLRFDEDGIKINENSKISKAIENESFDNLCYLNEISKKLKFRLDSNFQLNFSHGFNCEVERVKKKESPIFKQKDKLVKACLLNKVKILF